LRDPATRAALRIQRAFRGWAARRAVAGWERIDDGGDIFWHHAASGTSSWYPPGHEQDT